MRIESTSGKGSFKLLDGNKVISDVVYENWYSSKASSRLKGNLIEIKPANFWRTKILIFRNKREVGSMEFNWRGRMQIKIRDSEKRQREFSVKYNGVFKGKFDVYDEKQEVVLRLIPAFNWKRFSYNYDIETIKQINDMEELCILSGFASGYLLAMLSAA
ncbi:hypothetical protein [uncultured Arcticibacterium sp.]|uniref:hypothetical protein n=1 Tax=uncultured Arcticibacterium sp. TaxID=2173042 RepID=UPI0030F909E2